ncbi:MAG TPA: hypothetical protein VFG30_38265 [Polyangiales bacterium]|nr:hypothetical protein [Polyangiales bacterium]
MPEHDRISALILQRLTGSQTTYRTQLAELVVDQALALRVRDVADLEQLRAAVTRGFSVDNVRRVVEQHSAPGFERYARAIADSAATVGALVSPVAHQKLHALARKFQVPRARWADHALDPALVRQLLRPVWTQVLLNFAKRLPVPGVSGGSAGARAPAGGATNSSSITGFLTRSVQERAEKLIDRGRSAMGGLGAEVERRLSAAARDFSDTAAHAFRESLLERVQSDEGRELLGQILAGLTDHILRTRFADLQKDLDVMPMPELFDLIPELVSFAAGSGFVQEIAERELSEWVVAQGDRTLRELLDQYGLMADVRPMILQRVDAIAAGVIATPAFAQWLNLLLRTDENPE